MQFGVKSRIAHKTFNKGKFNAYKDAYSNKIEINRGLADSLRNQGSRSRLLLGDLGPSAHEPLTVFRLLRTAETLSPQVQSNSTTDQIGSRILVMDH
jgi:hypothetical protein